MSPYSRNVLKNSELDEISLDVLDDIDLGIYERIDNIEDEDILNIANNFISENLLKGIFFKKSSENISKYLKEHLYKKFEEEIATSFPEKTSVKTNSFGVQTETNNRLNEKEISRGKKLNIIINDIIKLKKLKEPLKTTPNTGPTVIEMKKQINLNIIKR